MNTIIDLCFLCTKDYNCVIANETLMSQVEYLLPEITIIKLGIPLRICSVCDGALCAFSKFKQSSVESSRRLEARIKWAQGPPLHTGSPLVVDDTEASGAKSEKMEEIFIKEEYVEETPLDTQMHTNRAFLIPTDLVETIIAEPHNQLHKDRMSQNIQLHTVTNVDNIEEISIKDEQIEETSQKRELYNSVVKEECMSNSMNDDTVRQPEHNTEDESATLNTREEVWEISSADSEEDTMEETDGNCSKNSHTDEADSFSCSVCNKKFKHKHIRDRHMIIHSGVKDFQCKICKQSFTQKGNLNLHMQIHSEVKEFQCETCEKSFNLKYYLTRHMKTHSEVKDFQCKICEKSFTRNYHLKVHTKIHTAVKEFQCDICEKRFARKDHLTKHFKIHSGVKEFKCNICEKRFSRKDHLTTHIKIH